MLNLFDVTVPVAQDTYGLANHVGAIVALLGFVALLAIAGAGVFWRLFNARQDERHEEMGRKLDQIQMSVNRAVDENLKEHIDFRRVLTRHEGAISYLKGRIGFEYEDKDQA